MKIEELRFQAIKEAQQFVAANRDRYPTTFERPEGFANTVVAIADFMLAYAGNTHKELLEEFNVRN